LSQVSAVADGVRIDRGYAVAVVGSSQDASETHIEMILEA
jgi:hypothetical protein